MFFFVQNAIKFILQTNIRKKLQESTKCTKFNANSTLSYKSYLFLEELYSGAPGCFRTSNHGSSRPRRPFSLVEELERNSVSDS
jgi:hypothetical protein